MPLFDQNDTSVSTDSNGEEHETDNSRLSRFNLSGSTKSYLKFTAIAILVIVFGAMLIGALTDPQVGSVFSSVKSLGGPVGYNDSASQTYATTTTAAATTAAAAGDASSSSQSNTGNGSTSSNASTDRMIIRTGSIAITANNVTNVLNQITAFVNGEGGLVFSTNINHSGDSDYATLVVQMPPDKFDDTMTQIGKLGVKVVSQNSSSQDVTGEYVDNDAAIKNLTTTENQLTTLMSKANTIGDVLAVQDKLTTVRGQIDTLEGRQKVLAKESSMSTLNITISPVPVMNPPAPTPVADNGWDFMKTAKTAWHGSLRGLEGLATVLITIAFYFWIWLPLLIVGWIARRMYRSSQLRQNNNS